MSKKEQSNVKNNSNVTTTSKKDVDKAIKAIGKAKGKAAVVAAGVKAVKAVMAVSRVAVLPKKQKTVAIHTTTGEMKKAKINRNKWNHGVVAMAGVIDSCIVDKGKKASIDLEKAITLLHKQFKLETSHAKGRIRAHLRHMMAKHHLAVAA